MPIPLVERSEKEMARAIKRRIGGMKEVAECREVTIGFTMKKPNIHFHVVLKGNPSFEQTHIISSKIDREVRKLVANARVVVHSEPEGLSNTSEIWKLVKKTADNEPGSRGVQNIHLEKLDGKIGVDMKLQVGERITKDKVGEIKRRLAEGIMTADPRITEVMVHTDSVPHLVFSEQWGHGTELASYVEHLTKRFPELAWVAPLTSRRTLDGIHLVDRVAFKPGTNSDTISRISSELVSALKNAYPEIAQAEIVEERVPTGDL